MTELEPVAATLQKLSYTGITFKQRTPEESAKYKADCYNAEIGDLDAEDGFSCSACRNKGWIEVAKQDAFGNWGQYWRQCKCMKTRSTIKKMKRSGLKDIIRDYTFDKYEASEKWQQAIKTAAQGYAESPDGWFFIGGQTGAGKTHICTAICREFLLAGKEVVYMLWRDDVVKIKSNANDAEKYGELVDRFKKAEILYIDDLFKTGRASDGEKQRPTGADVNVAFEVLNFRYNEKLPTIVSSECTLDDLLDIDEATGGRIFERAKAFSLKPDRNRNYRLRRVIEI